MKRGSFLSSRWIYSKNINYIKMKNMKNYSIFTLAIILLFTMNQTLAKNTINGKVVYNNTMQTPLEGVDLKLFDLEGVLIQTSFSNDIGNFVFTEIESGTYKITATSNQTPPPSVDLLDVALFIDYLNGQASLDPLSEKAANVDGSSVVDVADLNFLMENWYLNGESFPAGEWIFEEKTVLVGGKDGDVTILGSRVADVTSDYEPDKKSEMQISNFNTVNICSNSKIELPVKTDFIERIKNFYIEIGFNNSTIRNILIQANIPGIKFCKEKNLIKIIWADINGKGLSLSKLDNIFSIILESNNINSLDGNIWLTGNSSFVTAQNEFTTDLSLYISEANVLSGPIYQFINYPNPVSTSTTFQYYLPNDGDVRIDLYNSNGSLVAQAFAGTQSEGINSYSFNNIVKAPGYYIAKLYFSNQIVAIKTIIIS